jgi:hypothetical protein
VGGLENSRREDVIFVAELSVSYLLHQTIRCVAMTSLLFHSLMEA